MITEKVEDPSLLSELQSEHRDYTDLSGEAVNLLARKTNCLRKRDRWRSSEFGRVYR